MSFLLSSYTTCTLLVFREGYDAQGARVHLARLNPDALMTHLLTNEDVFIETWANIIVDQSSNISGPNNFVWRANTVRRVSESGISTSALSAQDPWTSDCPCKVRPFIPYFCRFRRDLSAIAAQQLLADGMVTLDTDGPHALWNLETSLTTALRPHWYSFLLLSCIHHIFNYLHTLEISHIAPIYPGSRSVRSIPTTPPVFHDALQGYLQLYPHYMDCGGCSNGEGGRRVQADGARRKSVVIKPSTPHEHVTSAADSHTTPVPHYAPTHFGIQRIH
ncbi:hypothetical protein H4582DRAFT_1263668 [Lactarius indigo]|nr:hypothetical protein H4582DRAFT_1263668 [Lactarius indigo]